MWKSPDFRERCTEGVVEDEMREMFKTIHFEFVHHLSQPPGARILTTQLYFPDQPRNARDGIFRPELLMALADAPGGKMRQIAGVSFIDFSASPMFRLFLMMMACM